MRIYLYISSFLLSLLCGVFGGTFETLSRLWVLPVSFVGIFIVQYVAFFVFLWLWTLTVDTAKPQEKESPFCRFLTKQVIDLVVPRLMKIHATGMDNIPKKGRFLLVSNHLFDLDPVVFLKCFPKSQLTFVSKRENNKIFMVSKFMHKLICPFINRENDREALKCILRCIQILKDDLASVVVFPEGGINKANRKLHHFRNGVFKIAQRAKVPIVVCTIQNTQYLKANLRRLKRTHVHMDLLTVIQPDQFRDMTTVELGEHIYTMMAQHLGPENVAQEA